MTTTNTTFIHLLPLVVDPVPSDSLVGNFGDPPVTCRIPLSRIASGSGGGGGQYLETAFSNQTSVNVAHNFGRHPTVQVMNGTEEVFIPQSIVHNSVNDFTVTFSASRTGSIVAQA